MGRKIVDVFLGDRLVGSYVYDEETSSFEQDLVDRARQRLREDGYAQAAIADARFIVRDAAG